MNIYIILIIIFILILIGSIIFLTFLIKDEKKIKEVDSSVLASFGKKYSKAEFEDTLYQQYVNILLSIENSDFNTLKDIVSDDEYNKILLELKNNNEKNIRKVISNIDKEFSKLISFYVVNDLEVCKLWIRYSSLEYITEKREVEDDSGNREIKDVIIAGSDTNKVNNEYILTFIKNRTNTEEIVCPSCGYETNLLINSKCSRCDSIILPKKMHWVYVDKVTTNISKTN